MKVLVTDSLASEALEMLRKEHEVVFEEASPERLLEIIPGFDGLMVRSRTKVTAQVIDRAAKLKVIGRAGSGVDNIDVAAAKARGVRVVNAPAGNTISVAELTIGHMIALSRHLNVADSTMKEGRWEKKKLEGTELYRKTLGIVGLGHIGKEVAVRAKAFGMEVIAYSPHCPEEEAQKAGVVLVGLDDLLTRSDFISIHTKLRDETRGLIGEAALAKMKPTAFLINCGRGGIVDEKALFEALKEKRIAGAALDVFAEEPPAEQPFKGFPHVILSPHIGASTKEAQIRAGTVAAQGVLDVLAGREPEFPVA